MKYNILKQLDNIIFRLNEDGTDAAGGATRTGDNNDELKDDEIKEILKSILSIFSTLRRKFEERYKNDINKENIKDFLTKLTGSYQSDANGSTISLSDEIKVNFEDLFKKYLLKCYKIESNSEDQEPSSSDTTDTTDNNKKLIEKYGVDNEKNILSKNNTVLTDDIINKLKTINWKKIKDNVKSIKTKIDSL